MTCTEARQYWMVFLDREADSELRLRLQDHLGTCPVCAKWFAEQERLEQEIKQCLSAGGLTSKLWDRVLYKAGIRSGQARRRRWPIAVGVLAAAAMVLLALLIVQRNRHVASTEFARDAAEWHEHRVRGDVQPEFVSASDQEVDRYLKDKVPFRVHCPPRTDVNFKVQGAGVFFMKDRRQAAYIVGHVAQVPVSILVLDRAKVTGLPAEGFHHSREGTYQVTYGTIADNVVVVVGETTPDVLERLLHAYGSYHEG